MTQKEMISDFQNNKDLVLKLYQELNIYRSFIFSHASRGGCSE